MQNQKKKPFYRTKTGILLIVFLLPIALTVLFFYFMFKLTGKIWGQNWKLPVRFAAIAALWGVVSFGAMVNGSTNQAILGAQTLNTESQIKVPTNAPVQQKVIEAKNTPVSTNTPAPTDTPQPTLAPTNTPVPTVKIVIPTKVYIAPTHVYVPPTQAVVQTAPQTNGNLDNNNTYTNTAGNVVHSPANTVDGSVPAGASARCGDGTYSFSQSRSGTCSHHGGVSQWL